MHNWALKDAIIGAGYLQYRLAERVGIHPCRLSSIVTGRQHPDEEEMTKLADALGQPKPELFGPQCE